MKEETGKKVEANKITLISKKKEEQMKGYMWDKRRKLYEKGKKGKKWNGKKGEVVIKRRKSKERSRR